MTCDCNIALFHCFSSFWTQRSEVSRDFSALTKCHVGLSLSSSIYWSLFDRLRKISEIGVCLFFPLPVLKVTGVVCGYCSRSVLYMTIFVRVTVCLLHWSAPSSVLMLQRSCNPLQTLTLEMIYLTLALMTEWSRCFEHTHIILSSFARLLWHRWFRLDLSRWIRLIFRVPTSRKTGDFFILS